MTALAPSVALLAFLVPVASTQDPAAFGAWGCLHDWSSVMADTLPDVPPFPVHHPIDEIAHAALLPVGPHQGKVLLWNFELGSHTSRTFVFDPLSSECGVGALTEIPQPLAANVFCAGHAFLPDGTLLVAGGVPQDGGAERVYRFSPRNMTWLPVESMSVPRFYPTVTLLNRRSLATSGGAWQTAGSSALVIGGPPTTHAVTGQPRWETLAAPTATWQRLEPSPLAGCDAPSSHPYQVLAPLACADVRFDSYPRALQLSSGDVFVAGDVDTVFDYAAYGQSPSGRTWFVRPPGAGSAPQWLLAEGPWMTDEGTGQAQEAHRRLYAPAVLLHELAWRDRVLVFGGASEETTPGAEFDFLQTTASVEELVASLDGFVPDGTFRPKTSMTSARVFSNAVLLPTREVLITGGQRSVLTGGEPPWLEFEPVHPCELYDPGDGPDDPGSTRPTAPPPLYGPAPGIPIDRLYHHVSLLLPDGRVLVAGGEKKLFTVTPSQHTAEIYSPPYLFQGQRPSFDDAPSQAALGASGAPATFTVTIRAPAADALDRVVLLRPGSVTHHFDADQRYVELEWEELSAHYYIEGGATPKTMKVSELRITSPDESLAPQGWYLLFVVHQKPTPGHRVPSVGQFIRFL